MLDYGPSYALTSGTEYVMAYEPVTIRNSRRLVLFSHGAGGNAEQVAPSATSADAGNLYRIIRELLRRDYIVASYTFTGTQHYGNSAAIAQVSDNLTHSATAFGASTTKVAWLSYSMGFALAANWTRQNSDNTAALVGIAPATDLQALYESGAPHSTNLDAAYSPWTNTATYNPQLAVADLASIPVQLWAGSSDTTVSASWVQAYADAHPRSDYRLVEGAHGTLWPNIDVRAVANFIDAGNW